jgi:hypothetical protein
LIRIIFPNLLSSAYVFQHYFKLYQIVPSPLSSANHSHLGYPCILTPLLLHYCIDACVYDIISCAIRGCKPTHISWIKRYVDGL